MDDFFLAGQPAALADFDNPRARKKRPRPTAVSAEGRLPSSSSSPSKHKHKLNGKRPSRDHIDNDSGDEAIDDVDLTSRNLYAPPSDEEDVLDADSADNEHGHHPRETASQKRLRLAKAYIEQVKDNVADSVEFDAQSLDRDLIAERLQLDALESANKALHRIASKYQHWAATDTNVRTFTNGHHSLSVTAVAVGIPSTRVINTVPSAPPSTTSPSKPGHHSISTLQRYQQFLTLESTPAKLTAKATALSTIKSQPVYIFSASKDGGVSKHDFHTTDLLWHVRGGIKPTKKAKKKYGGADKLNLKHVGHTDQVLCLDVCEDGKYLVTGGRDKLIHIWSAINGSHLGTFKQHRDAVSGLAFRKGHYELYSASFDRTIKVWNVDEKSYVETLFGHQDSVSTISSLHSQRCITPGSRDRTVRYWKIPEESHLIFRAGTSGDSGDILFAAEDPQSAYRVRLNNAKTFGGSIDIVEMITDEYFLSGGESGSISLWHVGKKKPLYTRLRAHRVVKPTAQGGMKGSVMNVDGFVGGNFDRGMEPIKDWQCWISCLAAVPYSDMFASGACDGVMRVWKIAQDFKSFAPLFEIPIEGFINSAKFFYAPPLHPSTESASGRNNQELYLVAGVGKEHRLGRWWKIPNVKNCVKIVTIG
ncbi:hypothetical protein SeMB42_g00826 [Synchytrium endobioticum]|uniref:Uncharacterized protein n=1 Tax=Synchytrium endobioticum TaxID=286115 RepID=A0A507D2Q0_9FUNG|nr:hypothetical protein SeLEV6574_g03691 [Synchytrium endobioticum]TPX53361.1 hypothetical protein SeMB42_g00826 [Synchytrium endobioticum]